MLNHDVVRAIGGVLEEGFLGEEQKLINQSQVIQMIGNIELLNKLAMIEPNFTTTLLHVGSRARLGLKSNSNGAKSEFLGIFSPMLNFISNNAETLSVGETYSQLTKKKIVPNKQFSVSINLVSQLKELVNLIPKE